MEQFLAAIETNQRFWSVFRGVQEGRTYVVTSHGRPVARIMPVGYEQELAAMALASLLLRLKAQPLLEVGR
jgi:prevent-host-death family protein